MIFILLSSNQYYNKCYYQVILINGKIENGYTNRKKG